MGLSISGGRDASRKDPFSQLIQIRKLYPLQPALECGKLALGDVILEVNGTSMLGLTNTVSTFLCNVPGFFFFLIHVQFILKYVNSHSSLFIFGLLKLSERKM